MSGRVPMPRAVYRGPVLVDPARPDEGIDIARIAHRERQARRREPEPEAGDSLWWLFAYALLAAMLLLVILPGITWLADGAPDNRASAIEDSPFGDNMAARIAP